MNNRIIENWNIFCYPANDTRIQIYCLIGQVVVDNGVPLDFIRFTKTSPIASWKLGTITTASGSEYKLGKPSGTWNGQTPLPEGFSNPWLSGDNWKTV